MRFADMSAELPEFDTWEVGILPSGKGAFVRSIKKNSSSPVVYRGALSKISFEGVNDLGLLMNIRRKDGRIEVKNTDGQPGFSGSCVRGETSDLF